METNLRPMSLGEILDRTVQFYRSRFLVFFGIAMIPTAVIVAIAAIVIVVVALWSAYRPASIPAIAGQGLAFLFIGVTSLVSLPLILGSTALAEAAINHAVNRAYYGETISIRAAYRAVWSMGWRYVGLYALQALAVWGVPSAAGVGLFALSAGLTVLLRSTGTAMSGALIALLAVLVVAALVGYGIWMLLRLSLAFPACVVEQISAWAALIRSGVLTKGTRGRIFLLYLLGAVLGNVLSSGIMVILILLAALIPGASNPQRAQAAGMVVMFIAYGAGFAVQALAKPVYGIALVLFYYDQRIRQEGFDIEWMMQRAGLVAPDAAMPATAPEEISPPPTLVEAESVEEPAQDEQAAQGEDPSGPGPVGAPLAGAQEEPL